MGLAVLRGGEGVLGTGSVPTGGEEGAGGWREVLLSAWSQETDRLGWLSSH